jgi:hypothetical protein
MYTNKRGKTVYTNKQIKKDYERITGDSFMISVQEVGELQG